MEAGKDVGKIGGWRNWLSSECEGSECEGPGCGHVLRVTQLERNSVWYDRRGQTREVTDRSATHEIKRSDDSLPETVKSLRIMVIKEKRQVVVKL